MTETNEKKRLVRRLPTESMVTRWVAHAKDSGAHGGVLIVCSSW